ncbi:TetR/AcrR family transcriptional regulator [Virgibacillus siamensis]|uniref:TetR/AcrR family transcriptional regulator n=1 Tax=Virgibacillus siamensis TaxID=480071 RepID=A0ABN1GMZ7_9BACI
MKKHLTNRDKQAQETKRKLIESAHQVFLQNGFEKTTISQIIKTAGVGYGTAYVYFKNKHELFIAIMEEVMQQFFEVAHQKFRPDTAAEASSQIKNQVREYMNLAIQNRPIMKVVNDAIGSSDRIEAEWENIRNEFIRGITSDINHSQEKQLVNTEFDPAITAKSWYYMNEMFMWQLVDADDNHDNLEHIVEQLSLFYTSALYNG